jgi:hypothetical protein
MDFVEDLVNMPKINDVAQDVIDNLKKVVGDYNKVVEKFREEEE